MAHLPGDGPINASNPCSEYMFLDDTACNLASLNLLSFYDASRAGSFDVEAFAHAIRLWTLMLEICVYMAQFPSPADRAEVLRLPHARASATPTSAPCLWSRASRTTRDEGRALRAALTAIMTGVSYATSAEMAAELGAVLAATGEQRTPCCGSCATTAGRRTAAQASTRGSRSRRCRIDAGYCPQPICVAAAADDLDDGDLAWARPRLPQRASHGDRARPAPSASSWTATRPASSPTSRS